MSRLEEVKKVIDATNAALGEINNCGLALEQEQLTNLILSSILGQIAEISKTLAIIADKLGESK